MAQVLKLLGTRHSLVVHGEDGLDELTLGGKTLVWETQQDGTSSYSVSPDELGLPTVSAGDLKGGGPEENARMLRSLFQGKMGPLRDVVLLNSAGVMVAGDKAGDLKEGIGLAAEAIDSGGALKVVDRFVELSQALG